jgi:hypothetical protein
MNIRPCVIGPQERARAQEIIAFSREHIFRPAPGVPRPGDDPRHVLRIEIGFVCVFTFTEAQDHTLWRHLSISVSGRGLPNPVAVEMIARDLFAFTGEKIEGYPHPDDRCIVVIERMEAEG